MKPILGTAMWGWTTEKAVCFQLLDRFYKAGFREVDGATNYPINQQPKDFRKAERIVAEWINAHGITDLEVMMKLGSVNNLRTPEHNLSQSFLLMNKDIYQNLFQDNLKTLMVHWDNREERAAIEDTFMAFEVFREEGFDVGFSGVKYPDLYASLNQDYHFDFRIQMKHNLLHSDYEKYASFHSHPRFIAYGINAGGLKLDSNKYHALSSLKARGGNIEQPHPVVAQVKQIIESVSPIAGRKQPHNFNQIGLIFAYYHQDISHVLLGTSKVEQLEASIEFLRTLEVADYAVFYKKLIAL